MSEYTTLFKTVHGSHLYGLAHAASDNDYYEVINRPSGARKHYAKQSIVDGIDTMKVNLHGFVSMANEGVPQALEAMFSPLAMGTDHIAAYRHAYRVGLTNMLTTYRRTIANFVAGNPQGTTLREMTDEMRRGDFKRRRHALRLALNFAQAAEYGRFNPTLSAEQAQYATDLAQDHENYLRALLDLFPYMNSSELLSRGYKHGPKMIPSGFLRQMLRDGYHTSADATQRPAAAEGMLLLTPNPEGSGHLLALTQSASALDHDLQHSPETACFFIKREEPQD